MLAVCNRPQTMLGMTAAVVVETIYVVNTVVCAVCSHARHGANCTFAYIAFMLPSWRLGEFDFVNEECMCCVVDISDFDFLTTPVGRVVWGFSSWFGLAMSRPPSATTLQVRRFS